MSKPNILYVMCDQLRFDCIAALGNKIIQTPNMDRLVRRGISFVNAYSTCPVCAPARYTIRTGRETYNIGLYENEAPAPMDSLAADMQERCGTYLAKTMQGLGYRTFGAGKFHVGWDVYPQLGYDTLIPTEEMWSNEEMRSKDGYIRFLREKHPEFNHIEQVHGERTEMYYMPQTSPFPPEATVEGFVANEVVKLIEDPDRRPFFGFVSFVGPHPPCAPPIPYNRMYNPDNMPNPVSGDKAVDHMDEQITFMNRLIWADEINDNQARTLKARYYGEITYIDDCLGKILDAVERREDADNTIICLMTDHGDHLGDHHAWQKESFFEASCHIPYLLSWPKGGLSADTLNQELVCLTDLFAIATSAAGALETRDGIDVLGMLNGKAAPRDYLCGFYGRPGTERFKMMLRHDKWKYIFMSNGGREQLFDVVCDPNELKPLQNKMPELRAMLRKMAVNECKRPGLQAALEGDDFKEFEYTQRPYMRIRQFDVSTNPGNDFTFGRVN